MEKMAIDEEAYNVLERIVGPENISKDPEILVSYRFNHGFAFGHIFYPEPGAVILPGSTEEVQAIVKACNKYKLRFKAHSTGWGLLGTTSEGSLVMDLRRMNRILKIDEKNQFAVVEPYVNWAQLQREIMKVGLNCSIIGAGAHCSPLASCTSGWGHSFTGTFTGYNGRNLLGVEWVLPTGEILRLGSRDAVGEYFCADGPGPSLRGIMRGFMGAFGGMGVFTKAAIKLSYWAGPPKSQIKGKSPRYTCDLPKNFFATAYTFPEWQNMVNAMVKICDAEIAYLVSHGGTATLPFTVVPSNKEFYDLWDAGMMTEMAKNNLEVMLVSDSPEELKFKKMVLDEIIAEEKGFSPEAVKMFMDVFYLGTVMADRCAVKFRAGSLGTSMGGQGALDNTSSQGPIGVAIKRKYINKGLLMEDGHDDAFIMTIEGGCFGYLEEMFNYDPADEESTKAATEYFIEATIETPMKHHFTPGCMVPFGGKEALESFGNAMYNFDVWQARVKKAFDPNDVSDRNFYATSEDTDKK
ncbi:MAG: FAD-binding oxidoreductase [Candidatus Helarchaeota archaeon]|nr:FAD-binding oxidoreductase [Candidatus Helarchaeota archaeon]